MEEYRFDSIIRASWCKDSEDVMMLVNKEISLREFRRFFLEEIEV
jgi:hypothetical protein